MDRGYPQNLIENLLPQIKFIERESKLQKKKQQGGGKRNIAIRDTIPTLSVY